MFPNAAFVSPWRCDVTRTTAKYVPGFVYT
jgi:hypothetical protein